MSKVEDKTKEQLIEELEALRQRVAEEESLTLYHNLRERVKELTCLHGVAQLMVKPGISLEEVFNGVVYLVKNAWQYPGITCARIIFSGKEFKTDNFRLTEWKQSSDIKSNGETMGTLEVYYLEEKPEKYEGPFLKEERALIEDIAQELGNFTERKQAEERIQQQTGFLRTVVDSLTHPFYVIDVNDYTIKMANKEVKLLGNISENTTCYALLHKSNKPCGSAGSTCPVGEVKKTKNPVSVEHVHYDENGNARAVEVNCYPLFDTEGNITQIIEYCVDITERKQTEERLRESKAFAENLIASMKDGFSVLDNQGIHLNVNEALCQITGCTREELIGVGPPHPYWPEEAYEEIQTAFQKTLKGEFADFELIFKRKNGECFPVIVSPSWLKDEEGNVISYFATIKDITKRKWLEQALRESEERYRTIFENTGTATAIVEEDTTFYLVNTEFEKIFGYAKEEIEGKKSWTEFAVKDELDRLKEYHCLRRIDPNAAPRQYETRIVDREGKIKDVLVTVDMIPETKRHVVSVLDITERKRGEQNLSEYRDHLEDLVKKRTIELEEQIKRRITYTRALVHELKTPLTPLVAASDFLVSKLRDEPLLSFAKNINKGALNLSSRIDELLDLARGEVGMLELRYGPVEFLPLLEDTVNYVTPEASVNGQSLILDTPAFLPIVWSDEERIRQVLLNFLDNAFKFTPKGGRITLKAREKDAGIIIEVRDNGCGIDEEDKKYLFEPYRQLESNGPHLGGLGLGLSLSQLLIELHGGHISVISQKGNGSTFSFWLPLKPTGQEKRKTEKEKGHEGSYY